MLKACIARKIKSGVADLLFYTTHWHYFTGGLGKLNPLFYFGNFIGWLLLILPGVVPLVCYTTLFSYFIPPDENMSRTTTPWTLSLTTLHQRHHRTSLTSRIFNSISITLTLGRTRNIPALQNRTAFFPSNRYTPFCNDQCYIACASSHLSNKQNLFCCTIIITSTVPPQQLTWTHHLVPVKFHRPVLFFFWHLCSVSNSPCPSSFGFFA